VSGHVRTRLPSRTRFSRVKGGGGAVEWCAGRGYGSCSSRGRTGTDGAAAPAFLHPLGQRPIRPTMQRPKSSLTDVVTDYASYRGLSPRQARILFESVRGRHDKEIALELGCMGSTVYEHWRRMAQKCGLHLKSEVIADFHTFAWSEAPVGVEHA
jgi:DNA-binding CsgD family transcriptional regulator